jgi:hypothetical protein
VRGLLCYTCNHFVLGFVEFDPIAAHNASVYLAQIAADHGDTYAPTEAVLEPPKAPPSLRVPDDLPF